jgi:adenosylcobinamide-phosphate synthase
MPISNGISSAGAVLFAFALDHVGEPPAEWHPVVWYGKLIKRLEQVAPQGNSAQLFYGGAMLLLAPPFALLPTLFIHRIALQVRIAAFRRGFMVSGMVLYIVIEGSALKPFFALHMLTEAGRRVRLALEQENLPAAREALQNLVSRDRSQLTPQLVAAATIESLAENLSDSVVAPLFYYALLGLPAAALYRLYNTFDSMIGYRGRYEYLGKAAARIDDLLNLLPSRFTALLIGIGAPLFAGDRRNALYIWLRDAHKTASPNAGHPMSAVAGALNVQLEKVDHYVLGDPGKVITTDDIRRAELMVQRLGTLVILLTALMKLYWSFNHE